MRKTHKSGRTETHEAWHTKIADELFKDTGTIASWGRYLDLVNFFPDMFLLLRGENER